VRQVKTEDLCNHIGRLREGLVIDTSRIHQESLKYEQINTAFSLVGYPILLESGDLLESQLA
jgi:phosphate:Na+ symporter